MRALTCLALRPVVLSVLAENLSTVSALPQSVNNFIYVVRTEYPNPWNSLTRKAACYFAVARRGVER